MAPLARSADRTLQSIGIRILGQLGSNVACEDLVDLLNDRNWVIAYAVVDPSV